MADDLQGLDSSPVLRIPVNYTSDLTGKLNMFRDVLQFPGTTQELIAYADIYPRTYELEFLFVSKQERYEFLEFWHLVRGEAKKFWYITEEIAFELVSLIGSLDTSFIVKENNFHEVRSGDERVCFRLRDGDILSRPITDLTHDEFNGEYTLETAIAFGRVIEIEDIFGIFFIVPARFDNEVAKITNQSKVASTCSLTVQEILTEYP